MFLKTSVSICLVALCLSHATSQVSFADEQQVDVSPDNAQGLFSADMDDDGDLDIVIANLSTGAIWWYDNDGTGKVQCKHVIYAPSSQSGNRIVGVEDFDGDGDMDVAVANLYEEQVLWVPNDGSGTFSDALMISAPSSGIAPFHMISSDLNGDGTFDLVGIDDNGHDLIWFENDGTGNFSAAAFIAPTTSVGFLPRVADADQDGDLDVFYFSVTSQLLVYFSNLGDNTFDPNFIEIGSLEYTLDFEVNDLDGDGFPEVVVADYYAEIYKVYPNDGTGHFLAPLDVGVYTENPRVVSLSDPDQDGDLDVLCAGGNPSWGAYLAENTGDLNFTIHTLATSAEVMSISYANFADLDGNGFEDPVCLENQRRRVVFFPNEGGGMFGSLHTYIAGPFTNNDTEVGDIDGDGDLDILISSIGNQRQEWYERDADGNYTCTHEISTSFPTSEQEELVDTDNDGDLDIILLKTNSGEFIHLTNDGSGGFDEGEVISSTIPLSTYYTTSMDSGDLNGDGYIDLAVTVKGLNQFFWLQNPAGTGSWIKHDFAEGALTNYKAIVECIDANADGLLDLVTMNKTTGDILFVENNGEGIFNTPVTWGNVADIRDFACADFNLDGFLDVVATSESSETLNLLTNNGSGNLNAPVVLSNAITGDQQVAVADLDLDGDVDIVANGVDWGASLFWFENIGSSYFSQHVLPPSYPSLTATLRMADLDQDGDTDILYAPVTNVMFIENLLGTGCTDPDACNFSAAASEDNGSCCYENCGCMDASSPNYDPTATCDDDSCKPEISGHVFHDVNADGIWDEDEPTLPNQEVSIPSLGILMLTNDTGYFQYYVDPGFFEVGCATSEAFPYNSTPNPLFLESESEPMTYLEFGLSNDFPFSSMNVQLFPTDLSFCDDWVPYSICIQNEGNYAYDGYVAVALDSLYQGVEPITPIDSIADGLIYLSYESLGAGESQCLSILVHTPTADHIGETMISHAYAYGFFEEELVAYGEDILALEVACAYDPNDKLAFPQGFTDDHLILGEEEIDFVVRFQNTGNAPAGNILIRDTLDVNLDLNSFQLIGNSHSVVTTVNAATREVTFFFRKIFLPDSTCCEEESHGFVSYQINPLSDLPAGTVLQNTAYIYFDNNDPIVTNTTWHTIHECLDEVPIVTTELTQCPGPSIHLSADYSTDIDWPINYTWELDEILITHEAAVSFVSSALASGDFHLTIANPLCQEHGSLTLNPTSSFTWTTCPGDLNCDLAVDAIDVLTFLGDYDCNGPACAYDFDGDGVASSSDLLIVIGVYGVFCE